MPLKVIDSNSPDAGRQVYRDLVTQLRRRREQLKMAQAELATLLNCSLDDIKAFEASENPASLEWPGVGNYAAAVGVGFDLAALPGQPTLPLRAASRRRPGPFKRPTAETTQVARDAALKKAAGDG